MPLFSYMCRHNFLIHTMLKPGAIYSYFNGLYGDNAFFHVVCWQLVAFRAHESGVFGAVHPFAGRSKIAWRKKFVRAWRRNTTGNRIPTTSLPSCQSESESEWNLLSSSDGGVCSLRLEFVVCFELHLFRRAVLQLVPSHFQELNFLSACDSLRFCVLLLMRAFRGPWRRIPMENLVPWQVLFIVTLDRVVRNRLPTHLLPTVTGHSYCLSAGVSGGWSGCLTN